MPMLDDAKAALRISLATTAFDSEVSDLIAAAQQDLKLSGVLAEKADDDTDPLIRRAVVVYVKANFGWDNPDAEKFQKSYDLLKMHLTLSQEYTMLTVTFTVTSGGAALPDAVVTFNGEVKIANSSGVAIFTGLRVTQNVPYTVTLDGYDDVEDKVDVDASSAVAVSMVVS